MNEPQYKIHGKDRKELKKKLADLKSYAKNFWHCHQSDIDMVSFYGGTVGYPMNDELAQEKYTKTLLEIKELENKLSILNK